MIMIQKMFSPLDYGFSWTENWYEWDSKSAKKIALQERNKEAKRLEREGYTVKKFTLSNQLCSRGGIGSGHPHVEFVVNVYGYNAY